MRSSFMVVVAVALMSLWSVRQVWLVNAWSLQYTRHAFNVVAQKLAVKEPPVGHARAAFWLAHVALRSGNPALAENFIASQAAQSDPFAMRLMADARLAQGDFSGALAIWQQAGEVTLLMGVASQALRAGHLEEALMAYSAVWRLDTESGTLPLANFLFDNMQDYGRAEYVLRQSLVLFPNSISWPVWSHRLGDTLRVQKRWDEAVAAYKSTIIRNPDDWLAHIGLGWARYERGDGLQAVIREFQYAIDAPESQGGGHIAIAHVLTREMRFNEAEVWFVQALALNPDVQWWYVDRGNAARQAGNLALALEVYQKALVRFPDFSPIFYEMAYAYQLNKQPAQAITAIEQALVFMLPPEAFYYVRAGSIYEWVGDNNQALHAYCQALLIDSQNAVAYDGVQRLGK